MAKFHKKSEETPPPPASETPPTPVVKPFAGVRRFLRFLWWCFVGFVLAFHVMVVALLYIWQNQPITNSMFMIVHRVSTFSGVKQTWVVDENIAQSAKQAVIAGEDVNFIHHAGFDVQAIKNAIKQNHDLRNMRLGNPTISQQLAKNLFLFPQRSYIRKVEEALITVIIELMWDKQQILLAYLNVAEFGYGIYGIEQASQYYFGKSAKNLTKAESAFLVSLLPNPKYYGKNFKNKRLQNRTALIFRRMDNVELPK